MQAVCAKCSRLMCRAVVLFLVAECAQTTPMIAPLPGDPNFSIDGSVAFFKSGESNPTQPNPPTGPQAAGAQAPTPRGRGDGPPSPRPRKGAGARPAPPPQPPAPTGTAGNKRARDNAPGRRPGRAQRRRASTNQSGMGTTPPMTRTTPGTPALLPAQGRQRDRTRQSDPPPYWPPRPHKRGARRTPPPPNLPPCTQTLRTRPTGGAQPQAR